MKQVFVTIAIVLLMVLCGLGCRTGALQTNMLKDLHPSMAEAVKQGQIDRIAMSNAVYARDMTFNYYFTKSVPLDFLRGVRAAVMPGSSASGESQIGGTVNSPPAGLNASSDVSPADNDTMSVEEAEAEGTPSVDAILND